MDRLWSPWRLDYIAGPKEKSGCVFCRHAEETRANPDNPDSLVLATGAHVYVVLNRYPYNNGHLLVAPLLHRGSLGELSGSDLADPLETVRRVIGVLDRMLRPQGYNVGLNQGKSAGAGLPGHLHWHVVPRWDGDTNFMPVLGQTKVIVESLHEFYDRLIAELTLEG